MESQESMELRDLPVETRNYSIIDNITGKPIEQSNYSLTIDPAVIGKLNELKRVNEEKVKQAALKSQYGDNMLVETFTPQDNSVFTPVYEGEYIDAQDFNTSVSNKAEETPVEQVTEEKEETFTPTEVIQQEELLDRVVARDQANEESNNSKFNPNATGLEKASEQILNIDTNKLGPAIKPPKHHKENKKKKISLDVMEIREGKGFAWLAYILFFLPLLINRKNRFVRVHANEGLDLNIMELLGAILILPYFLVTTATGTLATILIVCAITGIIILGMCALTIIPMMIYAMFGLQFQIPWLWKKRLIRVPETRE